MTGAPALLRIPAWRRAYETQRALEIQLADEALQRSRFRWFLLGLASAFLGYVPMAFAFRTTSQVNGQMLFWLAILLSNIGPMTVFWCAARSEEM